MMDRLERTLLPFVEDGKISPAVADELSREYHHQPVNIRQRLAELVGYVGVGLAVLGVVVIGSEIWSDFTQVIRAGLPAAASAGLLIGMWFVVKSVPSLIEHPARSRLAQVMGVVSAIMAALAVAVAFERPPGTYGEDFQWQAAMAFGAGLLVAFVASRLAAGFITTLAVGVFAFAFGMASLSALNLDEGPEWPGLFLIALGAVSATLLHRWFPPAWLTRTLGILVWLQGSLVLISSSHDEYLRPDPIWLWIGRASAVVLVVLGSWLYVRGGDWPWALGAALSLAMLVGLWSAETLNAGVALVLTGLVMIGIGLTLYLWRRSTVGTEAQPAP